MSDLDDAASQVHAWTQTLGDEAAPCGPDLEYDNEFLELNQAALGKPESQFGPAEPPDWPAVRAGAESLLGRSRDLRLAIHWLRAGVRMHGWRALPSGLQLLSGMIEQLWDHLHPMPDPDDGDMYARVNALTLLRESEGLLGDLRTSWVVRDRAVGEITGRTIEVASLLSPAVGDESVPSKDALTNMFAAALERAPELRTLGPDIVQRVKGLQAAANDKLGSSDAPDLKPLLVLVNAMIALLPPEPDAVDEAAATEGGAADGAPRAGGRGLSGAVTSRDEALRAIDMVCQYLEKAEPSNPAPLFLRRARQLVNHNFLQLMKELAPDALSDVARIVGVNPDTVETPERG
jgi:type VI secretion system protein ImpA